MMAEPEIVRGLLSMQRRSRLGRLIGLRGHVKLCSGSHLIEHSILVMNLREHRLESISMNSMCLVL